tara:strand:- start:448 stop:615 length:168 start_codon:yes stop_codon:yes gene_type:complete
MKNYEIEILENQSYRIACEMKNIFTKRGNNPDYIHLEKESEKINNKLKSLKNGRI